MAKRKKKLTFKDWNWDTAYEEKIDALAAEFCAHGARVVIEQIRDESEGSMVLSMDGLDHWVVTCRVHDADIGVGDDYDEIIFVETPLRKLIADTNGMFDSPERFDAFKAGIMDALAQLEQSMKPPTEEQLEKLRNDHDELAKRFPYMKASADIK